MSNTGRLTLTRTGGSQFEACPIPMPSWIYHTRPLEVNSYSNICSHVSEHLESSTEYASIKAIIAYYFLDVVPEINEVLILKESDTSYTLWSVVSEKSRATRRKIYAQEKALLAFFNEEVHFDFKIIIPSQRDHFNDSQIEVASR
jgi:hypothetical protein